MGSTPATNRKRCIALVSRGQVSGPKHLYSVVRRLAEQHVQALLPELLHELGRYVPQRPQSVHADHGRDRLLLRANYGDNPIQVGLSKQQRSIPW